jgi:hypothetical protein
MGTPVLTGGPTRTGTREPSAEPEANVAVERPQRRHDSECRIDLHPPAYRAPANGEARTSGRTALGWFGRSRSAAERPVKRPGDVRAYDARSSMVKSSSVSGNIRSFGCIQIHVSFPLLTAMQRSSPPRIPRRIPRCAVRTRSRTRGTVRSGKALPGARGDPTARHSRRTARVGRYVDRRAVRTTFVRSRFGVRVVLMLP